jgi:integrase
MLGALRLTQPLQAQVEFRHGEALPAQNALTARAASDVFTAIATRTGLDERATAHIGRHAFVTRLIRGGEDLVTVAELADHSRLETLRSQPPMRTSWGPCATSPSTADRKGHDQTAQRRRR